MLRGITKGAYSYAFSNHAYFKEDFHNIGVFEDEFLLIKNPQIWEFTVFSRYACSQMNGGSYHGQEGKHFKKLLLTYYENTFIWGGGT